MLLSYRNDNERVTLEQQECETDTQREREGYIHTFIKNIYFNDLYAFVNNYKTIFKVQCVSSDLIMYLSF